jgi:hypothetical protein
LWPKAAFQTRLIPTSERLLWRKAEVERQKPDLSAIAPIPGHPAQKLSANTGQIAAF